MMIEMKLKIAFVNMSRKQYNFILKNKKVTLTYNDSKIYKFDLYY